MSLWGMYVPMCVRVGKIIFRIASVKQMWKVNIFRKKFKKTRVDILPLPGESHRVFAHWRHSTSDLLLPSISSSHSTFLLSLRALLNLMCVHAQLGLTLCDPMVYSLSGSSAHGIFQAGILAWVAISSSRGSSQPRDCTYICCVSSFADRFFMASATWEAPINLRRTYKNGKTEIWPECDSFLSPTSLPNPLLRLVQIFPAVASFPPRHTDGGSLGPGEEPGEEPGAPGQLHDGLRLRISDRLLRPSIWKWFWSH